ncbi:MAG: helix-turn-helix domain-containing protein [Flavobacterium sp.]|nr:helix-turn-helix domain-containing protein [Flavobacterium sp.]
MKNETGDLIIPSVRTIQLLLEPIYERLASIESSLKSKSQKAIPMKFYRNADLKAIFGLSSNTIIKYRDTGILPYTRLGEVYLYDIASIDEILNINKISA